MGSKADRTAPLLEELHHDHVNVVTLMAAADRELDAIEADQSADYELLEDVMRYLTAYSDAHHHPNEDVMFAALVERAPETAKQIDAIEYEHEHLAAQGRLFLESLVAHRDEAIVPREELVRRGRAYFGALRKHMSLEETTLFPLVLRTLTGADWHAVRERILVGTDPLFGPVRDANFRRLWQSIEAHRAVADA